MAITIRERNNKRTSAAHPQLLEVNLASADGGVVRMPVQLGFDTEALSHFFRFTLERRAEIRVQRISDDPYAAHVGITVGREGERVSSLLVGDAAGDSDWVAMEAGTYRLIVGSVFPAEQRLELVFAARPRRLELLAVVGIDDTAACLARLEGFTPVPMADVRTVERYRPLVLDIPIDTAQLLFDFNTWSALLVVHTGDPLAPIHSQLLDPAALADGRFAVTVADVETATWPDEVQALIVGTSLYGRELVLLEGVWDVVDVGGGPSFLLGLPAVDDALIERHATLRYVMALELSDDGSRPDLTGWSAFFDLWTADFGARLGAADGDLALLAGDAAVFELPSALTSNLPDACRARGWLIDPDGGSHWLMRGDWSVAEGYSRDGLVVVRDDRVIQAGEDIAYRVRLVRNGVALDLSGAAGWLLLSQVDGSSFGHAGDAPLPLSMVEAASGIVSTLVPAAITELLDGAVAMRLLLDLPDGRTEVVMAAGVWTVSEGYSVP